MEQADRLPITDFYSTPQDLAATKPGDLLRKESFAGYSLTGGRHRGADSLSLVGRHGSGCRHIRRRADSGGTPPAQGWPVIAWAHGTSGVARQCAPSAMKDVYYGAEGLMPMVAAGFAVVATDYHGLGTDGPHQYVNKVAQAHDVIYSIPAAPVSGARLGPKWVVDGHSQGGLAAFGVAEAEYELKDPALSRRGVRGRRGAGGGFFQSFGRHARRRLLFGLHGGRDSRSLS